MVNTRLLQRGIRQKQAGTDAGGLEESEADYAPRRLRHDPILQGRIGTALAGVRRGSGAGLKLARNPGLRAEIDDIWAALPELGERLEDVARRSGHLPALDRNSRSGLALDQLRSQVLRVIGDRGWRRLGVSGPRRGAGASFVAIGLTASLARLDYLRIMLIDFDLSAPALHSHLALPAQRALQELLDTNLPVVEAVSRIGDTVALLLNDRPIPGAADALLSPGAALALRHLDAAMQPDLTILDLPPLLGEAAGQAALEHVDALLLVSDGTDTTARDITECEQLLQDRVPILGIVLNKSDDSPPKAGRG